MTNTMYLNHFATTNPSFIEISTRVLPDGLVGSWTREPEDTATTRAPEKSSFPAHDAWRTGETKDVIAAATLFLSLFAGAAAFVAF